MGRKRGAGRSKAQENKGRFARTVEFARGVRGELRRVSWPNRDQLQQSTAVVLIIVVVLTAFVAFWDFIFQNLARFIFT
jgi:preprotein translocase subunit SecE